VIWQNIIIGFDIRGNIKIFDFGLAKELKPIECEGKDQYHSSGMAGTRRYMAPEMAQARGYGKLFYLTLRIIIRFAA
jgi:serine/threonine protein kinase